MKTFVRNFIGAEVARIQIASKKSNLKTMAKKSAQRREKGTAEEAIWMPAPRSFIRSELVLTSKSPRDITIAEKGKWNFGAGNERLRSLELLLRRYHM